ncbi:hypothetical protein ABZ667_42415 [Streptomyces lavendulae]|uniref:hypothetical protein n=1 Tax=Streptomyces lavendulae TaxID=1914 RepID=UPI0033C3300C
MNYIYPAKYSMVYGSGRRVTAPKFPDGLPHILRLRQIKAQKDRQMAIFRAMRARVPVKGGSPYPLSLPRLMAMTEGGYSQ